MDESKGGFEGFVDDMGEVVLHLLGFLDIHEVESK